MSFDESQIEAILNAIEQRKPSEEEIQRAVIVREKIFGEEPETDEQYFPQVRQAMAVVRIRDVASRYIAHHASIEELVVTLGVMASAILDAQEIEYPYELPPDHHPLAQNALKLLAETEEVTSALHPEAGLQPAKLVRHGFRLNCLVDMLEQQWYLGDLKIGVKVKHGGHQGHIMAHGTNKQKSHRNHRLVAKSMSLRKTHPKWSVREIDERVGNLYGVTWKTVQRARLRYGKSSQRNRGQSG